MAVPTYTSKGVKATTPVKLDKTVFEVDVKNHELIKLVYSAYLANGRVNLAKTKTRGLVSGGGKKPWKQKGTGRARFGSSRVPIWRGGGITFGPTGNENYSKQINAKAKKQAVRQALSLANSSNKLAVIDAVDFKGNKVKPIVDLLTKIGAKNNTLLVVENKDDSVNRSTQNIPQLKTVQAKYLNVYDIMNADTVIIEKKALDLISDWLGGDK